MLKVIGGTFFLIASCKEHTMKMCRQGSNNLSFSTNLPYQSKETHFNTFTCSKYNSKNKWKTHLLYLLPFLFFFTLFIRDKYRIKRVKRRRVKTIMFFDDVHIRSQLSYKNSIFLSKNDILKIKFDKHQVYIKYQANEGRRIYVKVMFRLNENVSRCMRSVARPPREIVSNNW